MECNWPHMCWPHPGKEHLPQYKWVLEGETPVLAFVLNAAESGAQGPIGPYYEPRVSQIDSNTLNIQFWPSASGLAGKGFTVELPAGPKGDKGDKGEKGDTGLSGSMAQRMTTAAGTIAVGGVINLSEALPTDKPVQIGVFNKTGCVSVCAPAGQTQIRAWLCQIASTQLDMYEAWFTVSADRMSLTLDSAVLLTSKTSGYGFTKTTLSSGISVYGVWF